MEGLVGQAMSKVFNGIYRNKRVLITGHTGFKGSWLFIWLSELGAKVVGYALGPPTTPNLFEICNLEKIGISIKGDIRNPRTLRDVFKKYQPQIVFHMAAQSLVRYSYKEPVETYKTNVIGTVNLLEACRLSPSVRAIVNVTSDKCYENYERDRGYKENDAMGGYDPYSSSKGCAELITKAYAKSFFNSGNCKGHNVSLASVRAGNVIGGGDWAQDRLIPDCIRAIRAKKAIIIRYPDAIRPWQHVLEPLYGYLLLAQRLYEDGATFTGGWNFGPDKTDAKSVRWLVEGMVKMWGGDASWRIDPGDKPHEANYLKLDCSKAKSKLNWYPRWGLKFALKKTIEWYKAYYSNKNGDMVKIIKEQIQSYEKCIHQKSDSYK